MLGKLFNLTAGAGASSAATFQIDQSYTSPELVSQLESVQEDLHTRSLLYPDEHTLLQNQHDQVFPLPDNPHLSAAAASISTFDFDADIDLDMRDVRILIMQDGISSIPSALLYDSQSPPPQPAPVMPDRPSTMAGMSHLNSQDTSRRVPPSPRKSSLGHGTRPVGIQPDGPQLRQSGTFDRRPSFHSRSHSRLETESQRAYREYADEIAVFASCIFGSSEMLTYRGTSTKVHVLPSESKSSDLPSSMLYDGRGSLGRSSMRSSKLSQSFSSESAGMFPQHAPTVSASSIAGVSRSTDRKRVLITRLFPVALSAEEDASQKSSQQPQGRYTDESFPFPASAEDAALLKKKRKAQLKQKRTPMYAIALIVNLPQPPPAQVHTPSGSRSTFRGPGSYTEHDSFPSSYGSGRRIGWALATAAMGGNSGNGLGIDVPGGDSYVGANAVSGGAIGAMTDLEERMDPVTQHWDIIMRTLTQLQTASSATIQVLLRTVDVSSPDQYPPSTSSNRTPSFGRRRDDGTFKAPKSNAKLVTLMPNALMDVDKISRDVANARTRIAVGLRALRVVTGQNRWGIWRDEARWVSRWAATVREQKSKSKQAQTSLQPLPLQPPLQQTPDKFLFNLLTAFLSTHTDWLQALSPSKYRKRHLMLQSSKENDDALTARTIVVSRDKAAARRIIFILSAFLPAAQNIGNSVRVHRPSTSTSWGALSQSPPAFVVPIAKEQSLRRKINKRGPGAANGRRSSHSRNLSLQGGVITEGFPTQRSASMSVTGVPAPLAHLNMHRGRHERRPSDTSSIRTANLPFTGSDFATRKSSAAAMTTVTSDATVPHFATMQRTSSFAARPNSSASSVAADDLMRTLRRGDSTTSQQGTASPYTPPGNQADADSDPRNQAPRWGNMFTGFLSGRRRDSTSSNAGVGHTRIPSLSSWDSLGRRAAPPQSPIKHKFDTRLQDRPQPRYPAAISGSQTEDRNRESPSSNGKSVTARSSDEGIDPHTPRLFQDSPNPTAGTFATSDSFHRIPDPQGAFESHAKTTIYADDGVIDVDMAFPEYIRSFETAVSSPSSSGFLSTPGFGSGLDSFEQSCRISVDGDLPVNVAGWLQSFHPDFCLQAIPPQANLIAQIKESLRSEPLPSGFAFEPEAFFGGQNLSHVNERWVDIASAVVVDANKLTITRISYSRLVKPKPTAEISSPQTNSGGPPTPAGIASPVTVPSHDMYQVDERFVQEPIISTDSALSQAIERVIAQGIAGSGTGTGTGTGTSADTAGGDIGANVDASFDSITSGENTVDSSAISTDNSGHSSRSASVRRGRRESLLVGPEEPYPTQPRYVNPSPTSPYLPLTPLGLEEVPRAECKTVILSALEEIVRDVVQGKSHADGDSCAVEDDDGEPSLLRQAVRSWLENIESGEI
ncbi:hypothetical protein F503_05243 [Ophiostoma piceae UAMH 11346]|uniref:Folliculin-interacting protein N-terminal domain-containing protein n=1 Tax=Ophiostoma piceae (strain UAMH 11346) TaxID=1262450 RepID=S3CTW6_OPHP1|nr:hypothetical protein F503_05243 [Ophiostoma piceae UAMH 11346]